MTAIIFKRRSFFDETIDITLNDEIIAEIRYDNRIKVLKFENKEYYIRDSKFLIRETEIVENNGKEKDIPVNLISNIVKFTVEENDTFKIYYYRAEFPFGNNFSLLNDKKGILAQGNKKFFGNIGYILSNDSTPLKILLLVVLMSLNRKNLKIGRSL